MVLHPLHNLKVLYVHISTELEGLELRKRKVTLGILE